MGIMLRWKNNYMHETDILRNDWEIFECDLRGVFWVFGYPKDTQTTCWLILWGRHSIIHYQCHLWYPSKPCHVGILWNEYSQMSTMCKGFSHFSVVVFLHHFVLNFFQKWYFFSHLIAIFGIVSSTRTHPYEWLIINATPVSKTTHGLNSLMSWER